MAVPLRSVCSSSSRSSKPPLRSVKRRDTDHTVADIFGKDSDHSGIRSVQSKLLRLILLFHERTYTLIPTCSILQTLVHPQIRVNRPKVVEVPFSSALKYQLSIHADRNRPDGALLLVMKGAPERVVARCSHVMVHGKQEPLTDQVRIWEDWERLGLNWREVESDWSV